MGLRAGLDRCGKSRPPTGIRSPDRPARSAVAIPTALPGPPSSYKLDGIWCSWYTLGCLVENRDWWQAFMNVANESCGPIKCARAAVVSF